MGSLEVGSPGPFRGVLLSSCSVTLVYGFGPPGEKMAAEAPGSAPTFQLGRKKSKGGKVKGKSQRCSTFENLLLCEYKVGFGGS